MPAADVDFADDVRSTLLLQSPRGGRTILWLIFLFVLVAFYWAYTSRIEEVTRGVGKVIPSRQVQVVQNLEGGILSEILVKEGDTVKEGQLILKIDDTRFSAPYRESRANYLALKAKIARLQAETDDTDFILPKEVEKESPLIGQRESLYYQSHKLELETGIDILKEQVTQRRQELAELRAEQTKLLQSNVLIQKELNLTKPLIADGAVSEVEVLRLERQANELKGKLAVIELSIPRVVSRLEEAKQQIEERKLTYSNRAREELNEAYSKLESISASSVALQDRLKRTSIFSPVYGIVKQVLVATVGGVIQPGMDLVEIVPLEDNLLVEARVRPKDIAFLRPDQKAMVKFSAYDFTVYGGLEAKLEHISADSLTGEQGESYYLVRVRTNKTYLGTEKDPLSIIPGMVATVDILTGEKTILSYILKPVLRAQHMALRER